MDSVDSSMKPSQALKMFGGNTKKAKRSYVKKKERSEQERHTPASHRSVINGIPQHPSVVGLSVEERIQLYMSRLWKNPNDSKNKEPLFDKPVNVFTGELYTAKELEVEDDMNDDTNED